ncbi:UBP1-associated protein 2C-like [Andrographis paniculata]|uniref:UBP1-associated protein 2C-like n=1 Tax=Andrographis paniculata TaxID=175694 RepID=UPI0021E7A7BF|nr:UBP1-associated protein 2C-like [Andrographis paniculata]XP_051135166.1 UBP1-associated protein 2C-like [Andrographis paniculata]XP_051135167.1 UBP1-associated protein 2C-like [Andrographis paniculata]XP_051135169.1 UBP1-associated protein 2C-like [Andrographis paniculata]XP_051135170.1 UBP1-associated protein 2C-like [Andrographis paniculata]XP_051135171.1 UBP1-associated protein 2C-like [Andrographis paniculata]XP_051135172.1 UBP1-associated protein 2C-like [Andrographis paniculata]XP_0
MDPIKKRKLDENGAVPGDPGPFNTLVLTAEDARKILEPFTHDQLLEIVQNAIIHHPDVLATVRSLADRDVTQRKLFVRGLGWETTTEKLRAVFSSYGELDEAIVILDKVTGKSKGYGFVTFKHVDGAIVALKEPSKKIDGRMTVTQLAAAGISGGGGGGGGSGGGGISNPVDASTRKIYVANVPYDMTAERLLHHFGMYGEIEEGPLGFDKATGKSKGFALFVYKTPEAARSSLVDPIKNIDGHQLNCKLAIDGKRGRPPVGMQGGAQANGGDGMLGGHYGAGGGPGPNMAVGGGFGSGIGGPYGGGSSFAGPPVGQAYGGLGTGAGGGGSGSGSGSGLYGGLGSGVGGGGSGLGAGAGVGIGLSAGGGKGGVAGGGMSGAGRGYGLPPSSAGMGSGGYSQGARYSLSSGGYQGQHNQPAGGLPTRRVPPGGAAYQGMPPYY